MSGVVTDESGSPVGNMQVGISYDEFFHSVRTSTNGAGYYELAVETALRSAGGVIGLFGVVHAGGGNKYEFSAQPLPAGPSEIVKNVRLRQIRTINAGDSITLSIEPDSSVAWDGEDWNVLNSVWEKLHIRVPRAGTLTVEARPEAGASAPSLAVLCILVSDNCLGEWVKPPLGSGTASLKVQADSRFEIRVVTRSPTSPQRYVVSTSTSE